MKMGSPLWKVRYSTRRHPWLILLPVLLLIVLFFGSCALFGGGSDSQPQVGNNATPPLLEQRSLWAT